MDKKILYGSVIFQCSYTGTGSVLDRYNRVYSFSTTLVLQPDELVSFTPNRQEAKSVSKVSPERASLVRQTFKLRSAS